jgi:hypothetical protein
MMMSRPSPFEWARAIWRAFLWFCGLSRKL